ELCFFPESQPNPRLAHWTGHSILTSRKNKDAARVGHPNISAASEPAGLVLVRNIVTCSRGKSHDCECRAYRAAGRKTASVGDEQILYIPGLVVGVNNGLGGIVSHSSAAAFVNCGSNGKALLE